jgi:superfamily II DNA helicase RecQ
LTASAQNEERSSEKSRIDYREVLSEEDFLVYSQLREWRKIRAGEKSRPVYTLFNNEQLASIATRRPETVAELGKIPGIGKGRLKEYGAEILAILCEAPKREAPFEVATLQEEGEDAKTCDGSET